MSCGCNGGDRTNQAPMDRFTLGHAAAGVMAGLAGLPWPIVVAGALAFEIVETPIKHSAPGYFPNPRPDTPINATVDIAAVLAGYALARWLDRRATNGQALQRAVPRQ